MGAGNAPTDGEWATGLTEVETGFVKAPGLLTGECLSRDGFSYLQVTVNGDPSDPRTDDIGGDIVLYGQPSPAWGLHLVDVHVAMGDLLVLVQTQGDAFLAGS